MQHFVVLEVMHQRKRDYVQRARHIHRRARHAHRWGFLQRGDHGLQRVTVLMHTTQQAETFALPRRHHNKHHQTQRQRQPAAGDNLVEVRRKQRHVDAEEANQDQPHEELIPVPVTVRHGGGENRGQHHRSGYRDTVRRRQITGVLKADDNNHHREIEQPVDEGNVDLARLHLRGMDNAHWGEITQTHGLTRQGEYAGNDSLRGNDRRQRRQDQHRNQRPVRRQQEERVFNRFRVCKQQRALTEVIQHQ